MPQMKKVKLEIGKAAAFVNKTISNTPSGSGSKPRTTAPPSRGLRHFSMKVCEKVEEKGTTSYNEVADEVSIKGLHRFNMLVVTYVHFLNRSLSCFMILFDNSW